MKPRALPGCDLSRSEELAELRAVLASKHFARAPVLTRVLEYVCAEFFAGRADALKEYSIAIQALGRRDTFRPSEDSIVRVEMSRLRKRLQQYYELEGAGHKIRIALSSNGYAPKFIRSASPPADPVPVAEAPAAEAPVARRWPGGLPDWTRNAIASAGRRGRAGRLAAGLVLLMAMGTVIALRLYPQVAARRLAERSPIEAATLLALPFADVGEPDALRIAVGSEASKYVDASGHIWLGDRYFAGGDTLSRPDARILRSLDTALYQQARVGDFSYAIPLRPGVYELHLHFAEIVQQGSFGYDGEGARRFIVEVNGKPVLTGFDIASDAPGLQVADEKVFTDIAPARDGFLHLQFSSVVGRAILSGIEVLPGTPHRMLPVRIVTRNRGQLDKNGQFWRADEYCEGGTAAMQPVRVSGTSEPGLFASERFGSFSYAIPVAEGRYAATLRFADSGFETAGNRSAHPGRFFDISCNGSPLARNLDVLSEAGGPNKALEKSFVNLVPNAQGKLVLSFVPVTDYAAVRAIEVVSEGR